MLEIDQNFLIILSIALGWIAISYVVISRKRLFHKALVKDQDRVVSDDDESIIAMPQMAMLSSSSLEQDATPGKEEEEPEEEYDLSNPPPGIEEFDFTELPREEEGPEPMPIEIFTEEDDPEQQPSEDEQQEGQEEPSSSVSDIEKDSIF